MSSLTFRTAKPADLTVLYTFEQGIVTAERPFDPTLKLEHINYYDLKGMLSSKTVEVIVGLFNGSIVASGYVKQKQAVPYLKFKNYAYVGFMYVKPEFRGQGISNKMLEQLKLWALSKGLTELRLDVYNENQSAINAYEKFGLKKHMINMRMDI